MEVDDLTPPFMQVMVVVLISAETLVHISFPKDLGKSRVVSIPMYM